MTYVISQNKHAKCQLFITANSVVIVEKHEVLGFVFVFFTSGIIKSPEHKGKLRIQLYKLLTMIENYFFGTSVSILLRLSNYNLRNRCLTSEIKPGLAFNP